MAALPETRGRRFVKFEMEVVATDVYESSGDLRILLGAAFELRPFSRLYRPSQAYLANRPPNRHHN